MDLQRFMREKRIVGEQNNQFSLGSMLFIQHINPPKKKTKRMIIILKNLKTELKKQNKIEKVNLNKLPKLF